MKAVPDHPMRRPLDAALAAYLSAELAVEDFDRDSLATVTRTFPRDRAGRARLPEAASFSTTADMIADGRAAVAPARGRGRRSSAGDALIAMRSRRRRASEVMRAAAERFAPKGGTGFWERDSAFFDSGGTGKWRGQLGERELELYGARIAELVPDERARRWMESGGEGFRASPLASRRG